uniref:monovalent cation/H+ antiporter subunit A n=1 Tax=Halomonas sp. TaxID=1486246 RepID=UPI00261DF6F5|nr:monovalent cation/H+ antiporter subunit A [Halomonas sp.]
MLLIALIALPFIACIVAACMPANARNRETWLAGATGLIAWVMAASQFGAVSQGQSVAYSAEWVPALELSFSLRMDGLAWLFCMLILSIGLLVVLYARYYMSPKDPVPRFFAFLMAFMGSMLGVVLSGNVIQMVVFWELTSLTSFLLIGYWHHRADARRGARMALTVTASGGLCLLVGVVLMGHVVGSYELSDILASGETLREHPWYVPILTLVALGALTKSAQFPFHFWLPHAMAAPTPVSAYLHSATMVKAGIFLLMRFWPVLGGTPEWFWLIAGAGACTLLLGAFIAIFQHDLKGLLAYSTISHLGLITVLLGIGSPLGVVAAIFHTINHVTFKASLFMAVGIIDHETGTRDIRQLSGLRRHMPITATLAIVASAAMAGVPLLNGFLSKEMFFAETLLVGSAENWTMSIAAVVMGMFSVAYSLRFIHVFFGPAAEDLPRAPHEPVRWMRFPIELLVLACLVVGVIPGVSIGWLLDEVVISVLGARTPDYSLSVWHGFNLPLLMSVVALGGGVLFYILLRRRFHLSQRDRVPLLHYLSGKQLYESMMLNLSRLAKRAESLLGTRRLQSQLLCAVVVMIAVVVMAFGRPTINWQVPMSWDAVLFAFLWLVGGGCAIAAAWLAKYHRLAALGLTGATGAATCITFLWLSAPDLALTQLLVESVTTILILLGLRWLPPRLTAFVVGDEGRGWRRLRRGRDLIVAIAAGTAMSLISYLVLVHPVASSQVSDFYLTQALPGGGGSNVVNVLLVDFRSFDTLGEISVLAIVALTVYALLRRFRPAPESMVTPSQQRNPADPASGTTPAHHVEHGYLKIPGIYIRLLLPIIGVVSAFFFLRGHNLPGGGFIAGLIFATGLILQYILGGTHWVETHHRMQPHRWLAIGLLLAGLTGLGAVAFGYPFLTTHMAHVTLPIFGEIHLPSAFIFDLGVFGVVVGATMLILVALAHQSVRSHRAAPLELEVPLKPTDLTPGDSPWKS